MHYIYPIFESGRILKRELLISLRDYSYDALYSKYEQYSEGIIHGCYLTIKEEKIIISPGIIKCRGFIFATKEEKVSYKPSETYRSLKFIVKNKLSMPDYVDYEAEFFLDEEIECKENELEVCRFKLKNGSELRSEYKDYYDIQTEYDTLNLAESSWSGMFIGSISKQITDYFAQKVLENPYAQNEDVQFAYLCLQSSEAINKKILLHYIYRKLDLPKPDLELSNLDIFFKLNSILYQIRTGKKMYSESKQNKKRLIIVE